MTRGIHLIWTAYGTWLPGDDRGHWSPLFTLYGLTRDRGGKLNDADLLTQTYVRERMIEPPKVLDDEEQVIVAATIGKHVQPPAAVAWAAAVERTHVHLLIGPIDEDIGRFAGRLKGTSSSDVGLLARNRDRQRTWTKGFWKVFLFDEPAVLAVKQYIDEHNVRRGLPAEPFAWLSPYRPI